MTSYADDNRRLFIERNRKNSAVCASAGRREAENLRQSGGSIQNRPEERRKTTVSTAGSRQAIQREETLGTAVCRAVARYKKQNEEKDRKRAAENARIIRRAVDAGAKKVEYTYEDYCVKEHNFPVSFAAISIALTMIAVFLLLNYSQITKFSNDIGDLKNDMAEYNAAIAELDILINKRTDHAAIEAYAAEHGLVSSDKVASRYVSMTDSYKIEKTDGAADEAGEVSVSTVMSGVVRLFSEALGK